MGPLLGGSGLYTNDKFAEAQPEAIVGTWLVGARLAKQTFPTVRQQSFRNLPVLAQLFCPIWVSIHLFLIVIIILISLSVFY